MRIIFAAVLLCATPHLLGAETQDAVLVNHVGYPPAAAKICLIKGENSRSFQVVDARTGDEVFQGTMQPRDGIMGRYLAGDFSSLEKTGTYRIELGRDKSSPFTISETVYEEAIRKCTRYFSIQRCGPSTTGYAAPCHVDDGRRLDTGPGRPMKPHRDVSGGWHDACDFRKWLNFTQYGMIGLNRVAEIMGPEWNRKEILDELRWGNRYFQQ